MNANLPSNPQNARIHPLIAAAAVAVILVSATGVAAITGWLPTSHAVSAPPEQGASAIMQSARVASAPVTAAPAYSATRPESSEAAREARQHHHVVRQTPAQGPDYREAGDTYRNSGRSSP